MLLQIYNLSVDALSPQYYFLLPSGKIRDATFICTEEGRYIVLMASSGYIYTQIMDESSSAKNGPFYITNVLDVEHTDLKVGCTFSQIILRGVLSTNIFLCWTKPQTEMGVCIL